MVITPLGSGQEVGRSCHLLEFRGMTIMLDCGIHPGYEGLNSLPFFDRVEPESVDVLLVTHFHLDHAGSLPYFTERTGFRGRIFMTHPTKAVIRLLLGDYRRLMSIKKNAGGSDGADGNTDQLSQSSSDELYTEEELQSCVDKIELIDYHQSISLGGLKFHALNAGHVLGAAMFLLEIGGRTVLYTGDYSMEHDRHLTAAEVPDIKPDVLIVESTYGVQVHQSRAEREARFTSTIERVVSRGGRCLIPVFALGRAQELLLILDEHWRANPHLHSIPIYYASKLASRALRVCQTYANMMNARIRAQMDVGNPFDFQFISNLKGIDANSFDDRGPSVVFASPGMLQSGASRQLFDRWASDPKNGVLLAGYAVENTLAKDILNQPKEVVTMEGRRQPLACLVEYVSFSAHVDFMQNQGFITKVEPKHIVLVHGQKDEMGRLKRYLMQHHRQLPENKRPQSVIMPPNLQEVKLPFTRRRSAKVMGTLADRQTESVRGILVTQNFNSKIVSPEDLPTYTALRVGSVSSKLHVPFAGQPTALRVFLNEMFDGVTETALVNTDEIDVSVYESEVEKTDADEALVFGLHGNQVRITTGQRKGIATVEWEASPVGDVLADAVVALLMHAQSSAASIRLTSIPCRHRLSTSGDLSVADISNDDEQVEPINKKRKEQNSRETDCKRIEKLLRLFHHVLKEQFEKVEAVYETTKATFEVQTDTGLESGPLSDKESLVCISTVDFGHILSTDAKITVECKDEKLARNIQDCLKNIAVAATPLKI